MKRRNLLLAVFVFMLPMFSPIDTRADLITSLSVDVTPTEGGFDEYAYTLTNSSQSTVSVYAFGLSVNVGANLQSITSPKGWDVTYAEGDSSITWSAPSTDIAIISGSSLNSAYSVPASCLISGSSLEFSLFSAEPPVSGDSQAIGFDPDSFKFYINPGTTLVPGISSVPEPSAIILLGVAALALVGMTALE